MTQQQDRTRIYSHITKTRFLHIEDSLSINKIRFFIGQYQRGSGAQATAYHFLDLNDARPLFLDMSWGRQLDITDYKGSANGGDGPVSRVLKVKGPKDAKFWVEIHNGPGQVIGQGAVKPAGEPEASISIALTTWEARKLALALIEYMTAYRVATFTAAVEAPTPKVTASMQANKTPMAPCNPPPMPKVEGQTPSAGSDGRNPTERQPNSNAPKAQPTNPRISANPQLDLDELFETEKPAAAEDPPAASPQKATRCEICGQQLPHHAPSCRIIAGRKADAAEAERKAHKEGPPEDTAPAFFNLVNKALARKVLDLAGVQARIKAPGSWREKGIELQAMLAS